MKTAIHSPSQCAGFRVSGTDSLPSAVLVTGVPGDDTVFFFDSIGQYRDWAASVPWHLGLRSRLRVWSRPAGTREFTERGTLGRLWDRVRVAFAPSR